MQAMSVMMCMKLSVVSCVWVLWYAPKVSAPARQNSRPASIRLERLCTWAVRVGCTQSGILRDLDRQSRTDKSQRPAAKQIEHCLSNWPTAMRAKNTPEPTKYMLSKRSFR
eukprot:3122940-Rhodomonas_salina.3